MKQFIKNQKIIIRFLELLGLSEKLKFMIEHSDHNLITLPDEESFDP